MEIIILIAVACISFFAGMVHGYGINLRDNDDSTYMNVIIREVGSVTYVYEYGTERYILQSEDRKSAMAKVMKMYPKKDIIIIDGKMIDESV